MKLLCAVLLLLSSVAYATEGVEGIPRSPVGCGPAYWNPERDRWECVITPVESRVVRQVYAPPVHIPPQSVYVAPPPIYYDPLYYDPFPAVVGAAVVGGILHHSFHHRHGHIGPVYRAAPQTVYVREHDRVVRRAHPQTVYVREHGRGNHHGRVIQQHRR